MAGSDVVHLLFTVTTTAFFVRPQFFNAVLCVLSGFAIISPAKVELVVLLLFSSGRLVVVFVLCYFLTVPWVGLQCVILACP